MRNKAKYLCSLFFLSLVVVFISTFRGEGRVVVQSNTITAFVSNNYSNNSYAEVTSVNYSNLSSINSIGRRVTRTNKVPTQLQFGDGLSWNNEYQYLIPKTTKNSTLIANDIFNDGYIYVICCIRI